MFVFYNWIFLNILLIVFPNLCFNVGRRLLRAETAKGRYNFFFKLVRREYSKYFQRGKLSAESNKAVLLEYFDYKGLLFDDGQSVSTKKSYQPVILSDSEDDELFRRGRQLTAPPNLHGRNNCDPSTHVRERTRSRSRSSEENAYHSDNEDNAEARVVEEALAPSPNRTDLVHSLVLSFHSIFNFF